MALLVGLLVGLGRLSSDREWVALQACGVGIGRVLRPVLALGILATGLTLYDYIWAVPDANQTAREIRYNVVAQLVEGEVKPRVFFDHFPNRILFVRDVPPGGGLWRDVFLADTTDPQNPVVYLADSGHMVLDRGRRTVELVLDDGTQHTSKANAPQDYSVARFRQLVLSLDPETVFPRGGPAKGDREMSIAELKELIVKLQRQGISTHNPKMEIQKKFSIPTACLVFSVLGTVFGLTNRRDAKFASFVKGIAVIYVYYFILMNAQSAAKGVELPLPTDVVVAKEFSAKAEADVKAVADVAADDMILDIGPDTAERFARIVREAGTIIWNGPLGVFEFDQFGEGTRVLATAIARSKAFSLAGGGDTLAAIEKYQIEDHISYISTGGGAFLEFVEGKKLPAVEILEQRAV